MSCLSGITVLHCLRSNFLKTIVTHILSGFYIVFKQAVKLAPVTPSWPKGSNVLFLEGGPIMFFKSVVIQDPIKDLVSHVMSLFS